MSRTRQGEEKRGKRQGREQEKEQKQILRLRASYPEANHIAKAKKPFSIGEELIIPAIKDICSYIFGEAAVQTMTQVFLRKSTSLGALRK